MVLKEELKKKKSAEEHEKNGITKQYLFDSMKLIVENINKNINHLSMNWKYTKAFIDIIYEGIKNKRHFFLLASGRSAMILQCFATRLVHLGGKAFMVSNLQSIPAMKKKDILIVLSGSGTTSVVQSLLGSYVNSVIPHAIIVVTSYPDTTIGRMGDLTIKLLGRTKRDQEAKDDDLEAILTPEGTAFEQVAFTYLDAVVAELALRLKKTNKDMLKKHSQGT